MTIEVMKQALEALYGLFESGGVAVWRLGGSAAPRDAITALRQAISQPDCRGCEYALRTASVRIRVLDLECDYCTIGDKFQAMPKVMLYKVT